MIPLSSIASIPPETIRQKWAAGEYALFGRRNGPTAKLQKIPSSAAPFSTFDCARCLVAVRTGAKANLAAASAPPGGVLVPRTYDQIVDMYFGAAERWYGVQITVYATEKPAPKPISDAELKEWLARYRRQGGAPNGRAIWQAAKVEFGERVTRARIRALPGGRRRRPGRPLKIMSRKNAPEN